MTPASCPICGRPNPRRELRTPRLEIFLCRGCRHRVAVHTEPQAAGDYHEQYEEGEFLQSLEATRRRQGRLIASLLHSSMKNPGRVLDFGAGRGWFLEACREAGLRELAGADTSAAAVRMARDEGFEALELPLPVGGEWKIDWDQLSFRPRVLAFLDVVEHFPPDEAAGLVRRVLAGAGPGLELVVVKVPVSSGLLYRGAARLSRLGVPGPLEQLYQAGTFPPHFHYFSNESLHALLGAVGLRPSGIRKDLDFEPSLLGSRTRALARLPRTLAAIGGHALAIAGRAFGWYDSEIVLARPAEIAPAAE